MSSTAVRRATRSYRCPRCGFAKTYANAGAAEARYWFSKHSCRRWELKALREHLADARWQAVDRTPKPCLHKIANHQHGTYACYTLDRCRCEPCTVANSQSEAERNRLKLYGRYQKYVDAYPVRLHVRELMDYGIGLKQIVKVSGVSHGALWKLMYGKRQPDGSQTPARRVLRTTAEKLYAVEPIMEHLAAGALVDQTGTTRRLQALVAIGYSGAVLAERLGVLRSNFTSTLHGRRPVTKAMHLRVVDLYDELSMSPLAGHDQRTRISVNRARNLAQANGWLPPLAWDDDLIDDPATQPDANVDPPRTVIDFDEVAVQRFIDGDLPLRALSKADRYEVVARWQELGRPLRELELRGMRPERYKAVAA